MNELVKKETNNELVASKEQKVLMPIFNDYLKMFPETLEDKNFNSKQAIISMALKMSEVEDKAGRKAIDVCTKESIMKVAQEIMVKKIDLMKNQGALIVRGNKLMLQPQYQGNVKRALELNPFLDHFNFMPIYKGDKIQLKVNSDGRLDVTNHETSFMNIGNSNILGGYVRAIKKDGSVYLTEIMNMEQIKIAWSKSSNRDQTVHKQFPIKMIRKTLLNSICAWLINTTGGIDEQEIQESKQNEMEVEINENQDYAEPIEQTTYEEQEEEEWTNEDIENVMEEVVSEDNVVGEDNSTEENVDSKLVCADCGAVISEKVYNFSTSKYGKPLCFNCQKNH